MLQRRQQLEDRDFEDFPGLWSTGQLVRVPCAATEDETRCGGDPGFREREQSMWVEMGSGGNAEAWGMAQAAEPSGLGEQEAGSQDAQGLWVIERASGVPRTLRSETGCVNAPGLWATGQLPGMPQAVVVPGARGEDTTRYGIPGPWERQQTLGTPLAEAVPELVGEEAHSGNVLKERSQAVGEQEALMPATLRALGPVDQEAGYGAVSCSCGRRQPVGMSETVGMPKAAGVPKQCSPAGIPAALGVPRSGRAPARAPAAAWVSGPLCQGGNSRDVSNLWERAGAAEMPLDSGGAIAPEELWSVGESTTSGSFPGSWRRQAVGVPVAPEAPDPLDVETGSGDFSGLLGRRHTGERDSGETCRCQWFHKDGDGVFCQDPWAHGGNDWLWMHLSLTCRQAAHKGVHGCKTS
ncbi:uncharacterized protein ACOB6Z_004084 [Ctenodactylus gundi]